MKVTKTVHLIAYPEDKYNLETKRYEDQMTFLPFPHATYIDHKAVASVDVTFDVADNLDARTMRLEALYAEQKAINAEFTRQQTEIQRRINEFLAIEG